MPIERIDPKSPAARTARASKAATGPVRSLRTQAREEALTGFGQIISLVSVLRGNYADAGAIAQHGPGLSHEVALLGEQDEKIGSWLDYLTESGPYVGLAKVGLPLLMQLAANHGKLDHTKLPPESGVIDPALLEKKVKAEMSLASAKLMDEIRALEAQAASAQQAIPGMLAD